MIEIAEKIALSGTPTMLINGRKLEGLLPPKYIAALFDYTLKEEFKNAMTS